MDRLPNYKWRDCVRYVHIWFKCLNNALSLRTVSLVQVAVRGAGELVRGVLRGGEEAAGRHVHGLLRGARHQGVAGAELGARGVIAVAVDGDTVPADSNILPFQSTNS